jgi:hypothetical protein
LPLAIHSNSSKRIENVKPLLGRKEKKEEEKTPRSVAPGKASSRTWPEQKKKEERKLNHQSQAGR